MQARILLPNFYQSSRLAAIDITETARGRAFSATQAKCTGNTRNQKANRSSPTVNPMDIQTRGKSSCPGRCCILFKTGAGGAFLSDISQVRTSYTITIGIKDADFVELILVPKKENRK